MGGEGLPFFYIIMRHIYHYILLFLLINPPIIYAQNACHQLVWSDEFDYTGAPDPSKWGYDVGGGGWGNNEAQYYTNRLDNSYVDNGILTIVAKKESYGGKSYTSARLITKNKGDWKYGRIEVMAKIPPGRGTWSAIWMLPTDWEYGGWPESGEIDIMEHVGYDPNKIHGTVHTEAYNHSLNTHKGASKTISDSQTAFHLYAIEWFEDKIDFYIDDVKFFTFDNENKSSAEWPFDKRFHLLLNIAIGGSWGGIEGIDDTIFPTSMEVDYVRVYQYYDNLEISGKNIIEGNETALNFETTLFDNMTYNWTVPDGVQIVNGQGTNKIEANWNDLSGAIEVSIDPGIECDVTVLSYEVVVPIKPAGDVFIVDDFETDLSANWITQNQDINLANTNGNFEVNYKISAQANFYYEFDSPLNLEDHGLIKFPFKLNEDAANNPEISVTFEDYQGNQTQANWLTFKPVKDGAYHVYSFDYNQLWNIVNPNVSERAITKLNFTLNFGNSGFTIPEILIYRSNVQPEVPQNFAVELIEGPEYAISWDDVNHAYAYNLHESKSEDGTYVKIQNRIPSGENPNTLSLRANYFYKLSAVNNHAESDLSEAKIAETITSVPDLDKPSGIRIYPNPIRSNSFNIHLDSETNIHRVSMHDFNGKEIKLNIEKSLGSLDISTRQNIIPGLYFITVKGDSEIISKAILVN